MKLRVKDSSPDLILHSGKIGGQEGVQSLAVKDTLITALGSSDDVMRLAGAKTKTVDLGGRLVLPGFIDTHIHFHEWAMKRQQLQLGTVSRLEELLECVFRKTQSVPPGQWILGQGWNETDWERRRMPTRKELDRVAPDHPVLLWRCDLHLAVANSAALGKAQISQETEDPPRGRIERDENGEPTGILRELAINLIRDAVDPPDSDKIAAAYNQATEALYCLGLTGVHDIRLMDDKDGGTALQTFHELERIDQLGLRSWVTLPGDRLDQIIGLGIRSGLGSEKLRIGHVKFFSDGGVGARTAWMTEPYLDADHGMPLMDMDTLAHQINKADRAGLSVMVHAIGDRANRELIDIFEEVLSTSRSTGCLTPAYPHRLEHLQVIQPDDVARLGALPLALGVTPANLLLDINLINTALGERGDWAYSFRRLLDTGLPVMFSSDCPVCDPNPLLGIHAAVNRYRQDGTPEGGWYPEARIGVEEAVDAYTTIPASVHKAVELGEIGLQKKADLAIFNKDFINNPPEEILETQVDMTLFDGEIVFRNY